MISKELLSEVLEYDAIIFEGNTSLNPNRKDIVFRANTARGKIGSINIYELAHKCKEWALSNGYFILSAVDGYLIVEDTKDNYKQVYRNSTSKEIPEYIAIFKACEWILEQKRIDDES